MNTFLTIILVLIIIILLLAIYNKLQLKQYYQDICKWNRYGCCGDGLTTKLDIQGSNCRGF